MIGKIRLKRVENDALRAIKCLTRARCGKWTSHNLRATAMLFETVVAHLRQIADEMDDKTHITNGSIADSHSPAIPQAMNINGE